MDGWTGTRLRSRPAGRRRPRAALSRARVALGRSIRRRAMPVAATWLAALVVFANVAVATHRRDGAISACFHRRTGAVTLIRERRLGTRCPKGTVPISWNAHGPDGVTGATGATGPAGTSVAGAPGPVGPAGPAGPIGASGPTGPVGPTGATGAMGPPGLDGLDGTDGLDGATGPPGLDGATGPAGLDGATGPAGLDGATGPAGLDGATGPPGPPGLDGATGPSGPPGLDGATGPPGSDGEDGNTVRNGSGPPSDATGNDGDFYLDTTTWELYGPKSGGTWPPGISLIGPVGPIGPIGPGEDPAWIQVSDATTQTVAVADTFQNLTWSTTGLADGFGHVPGTSFVTVARAGVYRIDASIPVRSLALGGTATVCAAVNGVNAVCQSTTLDTTAMTRVIPLTAIVSMSIADTIGLRLKGTSTSVQVPGSADAMAVMTIVSVD